MLLQVLSKQPLNTDRLGAAATSLGSLFQCLAILSGEELFPKVNSEAPLVELWAIPTHPVSGYQRGG